MDTNFKYAKSKQARSHEESRQIICCCCGKKVKTNAGHKPITKVNEKYEQLIKMVVYSEYSVNNAAYPTGLCDGCRLALVANEKVISYIYFSIGFLFLISRKLKVLKESFPTSSITQV